MSLIASDTALLQLDGQTVSGITKQRLSLSRKLTDRTHAFSAGWADHSSRANPAQADLRAEGVFLSNDAMTSVRSAFLTGEAEPWALVLPGDGTWAGQFFVRDLQLSGVAESEISFSLRLLSSGPISFQMEI